MIIIIVIALIVLGYFGFNIQNIINSPTVQKNLNYAWSLVTYIWQNFLKTPAIFIWDKFVNVFDWIMGSNKTPDKDISTTSTALSL